MKRFLLGFLLSLALSTSASAASRFWVGGTGTWDSSTTTHWAASSGGAGGQSVPTSADTVTFNGSSGAGTVTLGFGGTITIQSLDISAFTGTFDNSVNNNNITMTTDTGFSADGSGVTVKLGTATYTLSSSGASWNTLSTTSGHYAGNTGSTIAFTGTGSTVRTFTGGSIAHGAVTISALSGAGSFFFNGAGFTLQSLSVTAPNYVRFSTGTTTIATAFTIAGSASNQIGIFSNTLGNSSSTIVAAAANSTASWTSFRDMTFTGSPTAANSFNLGNNSGITITAPQALGSGGGSLIGG